MIGRAYELLKNTNVQSIRFHNWLKAYTNPAIDIDQLPSPDGDWEFKGGMWDKWGGVPLEVCVDFANRLTARGWYSLPYALSRNAIETACIWIEAHSDQPYTVEIGNEAWQLHDEEWIDKSPFGAQQRFLVRQVWGDLFSFADVQRGHAKRVRQLKIKAGKRATVIASCHMMNLEQGRFLLENQGLCDVVDGIALGAYFGVLNRRRVTIDANETVQSLHRKMIQDIHTIVKPAISAYADLAAQNGVKLMIYEAGQHANGGGDVVTEWNRSEYALEAYRELEVVIRQFTDEPIHWYSSHSTYGDMRFGLAEIVDGELVNRPKFGVLE